MDFNRDFEHFHRHDLPALLDGDWGAVAQQATVGLPSLAIRLPDGRACAYQPGSSGVELKQGVAEGSIVVELDEADWVGLYDSMETPSGLVLSNRARIVAGAVSDFMDWEPALRVLYERLPLYDPSAPLLGRDGREVDPSQSFHPDADPEAMADFLRTTGYLLIRELIPQSEVDELLADSLHLQAAAREDDRASWWGRSEDGQVVCTRVNNGGTLPRVRALPSDPRFMRIVGLSDFELEATDTEKIDILFKRSGMVFDGLADNPWHRDCGLGGHKRMCPLMNGSLFLRPANRESGELRFLPGSWKTAGSSVAVDDHDAGVGIEAAAGDFALHYGDGVHAGPPPTSATGPFRVSIVFEYGPPGRSAEEGQEHYDQLMYDADAGQLRSSDPTRSNG